MYEENGGYKRKYEIGLSGDFMVHSDRVGKAYIVHTHAKIEWLYTTTSKRLIILKY